MIKKFLLIAIIIFVIPPVIYADRQACLLASNEFDPSTMKICEQALSNVETSVDDKSIIYITQAGYLIRKNKFNDANAALDLAFNINPKMLENGIFRYNWLRKKGSLYYAKDEYLNSQPFFERAMEVAQIMGNNTFMANSYNDLGAVYLDLDKYHQSLEWSQKSLKIHYELKDDYRIALSLANIAEIYLMLQENKNALKYFNLSIDSHRKNIAKDTDQKDIHEHALAKVHQSLGKLKTILGNPDEALNNLEIALSIYNKYELKGQQVGVLAALGKMHLEHKNTNLAINFLKQAFQIEATLESQDNLDLKNYLVNAYIATENWQLAEKSALGGLQQAINKNNQDSEAEFLALLSTIYQQIGDLSQSIKYLKKSQVIKETLLDEKYHKSRGKLLAEIELNQNQRELLELEEQQTIRELNSSRQRLIFVILAILLLFIIGYLLFRLNRKDKIRRNIRSDQASHFDQLKLLGVKKEEIEYLFQGMDCRIICFDSAGNIHYNSENISLNDGSNNKNMQNSFADIWQLLLPHIDDDEKLSTDLFFDKDASIKISGGVWIHQMNFLDNILVCLLLEDEKDNDQDFKNAESIRKYSEFKQQLSEFFIHTKSFSINKVGQLNQVLLAIKAINTKTKSTSSDNTGEDFKRQLVDLMITCIEIWQQATSSSSIELAEKSGLWLVSIEEGQLRTRTMNKYTDISKIPNNPRWRQVIKTAHFILSNCELNINDRQILNTKTDTLKQIIRSRAIGN